MEACDSSGYYSADTVPLCIGNDHPNLVVKPLIDMVESAVETADSAGYYSDETVPLIDGWMDHLRPLHYHTNSATDIEGYGYDSDAPVHSP